MINKKKNVTPTPNGLQKVRALKNEKISSKKFRQLLYSKRPILIRGLAKKHKNYPTITYKYLIKNYGQFETIPRNGEDRPSSKKTIREILTEVNPKIRQTIASTELTKESLLIKDIGISNWIPDQSMLRAPFLKNTLFVSSEGFFTRLHMEAGRLLNVQLSGKKTWYLIDSKYSHLIEPLITDTTIHFSDIVKEISDIENKLAIKVPVYTCTLEEGDVLLIPPFFWHTVFCREKAVSTTYQWLTLFKPFFENPFMSLFILTSRNPSIFDALRKKRKK